MTVLALYVDVVIGCHLALLRTCVLAILVRAKKRYCQTRTYKYCVEAVLLTMTIHCIRVHGPAIPLKIASDSDLHVRGS